MSHFSLRPVTDKDGSRSPTGSTSTASSHTPPPLPMMQRDAKQLPGLPTPQLIPATVRPRRPLSPSSLRGASDADPAPKAPLLTVSHLLCTQTWTSRATSMLLRENGPPRPQDTN